MEMQLDVVSKELSVEDNNYLDDLVSQVIDKHKENYGEINRLVMDSVTCLATSEARAKGLRDQGPVRRLLNNITGKNQKLQANVNLDLAQAQRASQKMIQKLAEQNLITFDTVVAVNNKLNSHMIEVDQEIEEIYRTLITFFKQTQSNLVQLGTRLDKVERNVDLLHWHETIEYRMLNGVEYQELPPIEKLICITNDFYHATGKNWSTKDLMLLKSTFDDIALPVKSEISLMDFIGYNIENPHITEKLFEGLPYEGLSYIEPYEAAPLKGIEKAASLSNEDHYIISTVEKQLTENGIKTSNKEIKIGLVDEYVENMAFRNTESKMTVFDLSLELLSSLKMTEEEYNRVLEEQNQESESEIQNKALIENQESELVKYKNYINRKDSLYKDLILQQRQLLSFDSDLVRYFNFHGKGGAEYRYLAKTNDIVESGNKIVVLYPRNSIFALNPLGTINYYEDYPAYNIFIRANNFGKITLLKEQKNGVFGALYHENDDVEDVMKWLNSKIEENKDIVRNELIDCNHTDILEFTNSYPNNLTAYKG